MFQGLYTYVATALAAAAFASAGTWRVQEWRWGNKEAARLVAEQQAEAARQAAALQQRQAADAAAGKHAARVAALSNQLGDARAQIARLSDRQCLDAGTVRLLNGIGTTAGLGLRAPASNPAGAPPAAAGPAPDGAYASERDTADWIATCRGRYAQVSDQLNQILDIEERREQGSALPGPGRE